MFHDFYFTNFEHIGDKIVFSANFKDKQQYVTGEIYSIPLENMNQIRILANDIDESQIAIPYRNLIYVISVEYANNKLTKKHLNDMEINVNYFNIVPSPIYMVMCSMIACIL